MGHTHQFSCAMNDIQGPASRLGLRVRLNSGLELGDRAEGVRDAASRGRARDAQVVEPGERVLEVALGELPARAAPAALRVRELGEHQQALHIDADEAAVVELRGEAVVHAEVGALAHAHEDLPQRLRRVRVEVVLEAEAAAQRRARAEEAALDLALVPGGDAHEAAARLGERGVEHAQELARLGAVGRRRRRPRGEGLVHEEHAAGGGVDGTAHARRRLAGARARNVRAAQHGEARARRDAEAGEDLLELLGEVRLPRAAGPGDDGVEEVVRAAARARGAGAALRELGVRRREQRLGEVLRQEEDLVHERVLGRVEADHALQLLDHVHGIREAAVVEGAVALRRRRIEGARQR
mmetsp:Transcript_1940/g.5720  ORF Transcript_1940/g.5720 Transcript_1940/m.5720 type:complete len:354 (-) Transcript_1940:1484-2545(-)